MQRLGFPKDVLVIHNSNKGSVILYDFDRRIHIELNNQAFLILDIINSNGSDKQVLELTENEEAKQKINDIVNQAKAAKWLIEVEKPSEYHLKEIKTTPGLELIQWELTNKCNLKCIHCYNESCETNDTLELTTSEVKSIIDQADELGVWQFDLTGGEIFMRNDIMEILEYLRYRRFAVRIATNGTLITDNIVEHLERLKIRAYATSIDGGSPETNDHFRGADGAFKKAYNNLLKIKNSKIPIRRVNVTATTLNQHEMDSINKMYTDLDIPYVVDNIVASGRGEIAIKYNVSHADLIKYKIQSYLRGNDENYRKKLLDSIGVRAENISPSCGVYTNRIFVMASGEYTFCPTLSGREHEDFKLGDSRKVSLNDAWVNAQNFIQNINTNCANIDKCKYAIICKGGCRSRAYIASGNFTSPDKVMCEYLQYFENQLLSEEKMMVNG